MDHGRDGFIYSLVLVPALRDLLPKSGMAATPANVGYYGGLLFALFMIGWGTALIWGPIADRFGRVRTMMFSISWFSLFTLLSAFATGIWSLAILRFLAGVGIGGEWSVGAALVAEEWPEERRTKGGAWMHTGYYFGFFLAAAANYFIGSRFGWRYMFVVGGLPALLVGFIRNNVREPERWATKLEDLGKQWKMGSARQSVKVLVLRGFLETHILVLCSRHRQHSHQNGQNSEFAVEMTLGGTYSGILAEDCCPSHRAWKPAPNAGSHISTATTTAGC